MADKHVKMRGISKTFFATRALNNVDFSCASGEVHALVGLNGAGKSTLMKVLGGVIQADEGSILLNDKEVNISAPSDANQLGMSIIHQEYSLINELTVTGNIFLGRELRYGGTPFLNKAKMVKQVQARLDEFGLKIDPTALVSELNSGEKQIVEIIRSIMSNSWLIVMDEPTSALSEEDKKKLFSFIKRMQEKGIAIIYISHHMPEIFSIANRITVMRDGMVVLSEKVLETTEDFVIQSMTGKELENFIKPEKKVLDKVVLSVKNLCKSGVYKEVSFTVKCGEIAVVTGLRGCGAPDLAKAIFGLDSDYSGEIRYKDELLTTKHSPSRAIKKGMGLVTENRDKNGIFAPLSVRDNISFPFLEKYSKKGLLDVAKINEVVAGAIKDTSIKTSSDEQEIQFLSGGNKQKACFSRWLNKDIELLILLEPTRGIDVHAKADIYRIIETLSKRGVGILILSYEVDEVIMLADRIITLYQGEFISEYQHPNFDKDKILSDMVGATH